MQTRSVLVGLASVAAVVALGVASVSKQDAPAVIQPLQTTQLCGGNNDIKTAPVHCTNSKVFTFGALQRTVTIVLDVPADGINSTVTFTIDKPAPAPFPIRVVAHEGKSGDGGAVDSDTALDGPDFFPAGTLGPVVLSFTTGCGQIDIKAVFIGNGAAEGRVAGPYVCATQTVPTTTVAPTTTVGTTVPGATTTTPAPAVSVVTVAQGKIPATQ